MMGKNDETKENQNEFRQPLLPEDKSDYLISSSSSSATSQLSDLPDGKQPRSLPLLPTQCVNNTNRDIMINSNEPRPSAPVPPLSPVQDESPSHEIQISTESSSASSPTLDEHSNQSQIALFQSNKPHFYRKWFFSRSLRSNSSASSSGSSTGSSSAFAKRTESNGCSRKRKMINLSQYNSYAQDERVHGKTSSKRPETTVVNVNTQQPGPSGLQSSPESPNSHDESAFHFDDESDSDSDSLFDHPSVNRLTEYNRRNPQNAATVEEHSLNSNHESESLARAQLLCAGSLYEGAETNRPEVPLVAVSEQLTVSSNDSSSCKKSILLPQLHQNCRKKPLTSARHMGTALGGLHVQSNTTALGGSVGQLSVASSLLTDPLLPICKICHLNGKEGDPLISPCKCAGTMQFIHCGCLMRWLEISSKKSRKPLSCELCQYQYHWHKKFKVDHLQFPYCSRKDKVLHLLFFLSLCVMISCAVVTVLCFKRDRLQRLEGIPRPELSDSELSTLICGVLFFLSFFTAMYVQVKARNTLYRLVVKFIYLNQQWYIDEYEKKDSSPVEV